MALWADIVIVIMFSIDLVSLRLLKLLGGLDRLESFEFEELVSFLLPAFVLERWVSGLGAEVVLASFLLLESVLGRRAPGLETEEPVVEPACLVADCCTV